MKCKGLGLLWISVVEIATPAFAQQPQFKSTGKPPPGPAGQYTHFPPVAMTDKGEVGGSALGTPIVWNPQTGYKALQSSGSDQLAYVTDFIGAQDIPIGGVQYGESSRPVTWPDRDGPPAPIPGFPIDQWYVGLNTVYANANGSMIVGQMYHKQKQNTYGLCIWRSGQRKAQGWEFITQFPPGKMGVGITDLSDHSVVAVGGSVDFNISKFEAMRWSKATGFVFDADLFGGNFESAYNATNALGTVAVGSGAPQSPAFAAIRWTSRTNMIRLDENAPPPIAGYSTSFFDSDHSGFMHVGGVIQEAPDAGIIWNPLDGMRSFKSVLVNDYALSAPVAWKFYPVEVTSPDGRFVAGRGMNPSGVIETWWAEIRPFCYADCDRSSTPKGGPPTLDIDDFICYMTHFALDDLYANCNNDADLDIEDFICFQTAWACGC